MISQSESAGASHTGRREHMEIHPARLLDVGAGRGVSRLEFYPIEPLEPAKEVEIVEVEASPVIDEEITTFDPLIQMEDVVSQMETVRNEARSEARQDWEAELNERIAQERLAIKKSCEQFLSERKRYFAEVEAEVVKLALAIAARVLHREVKLDPLLLAGVVRVALDKVAEDSGTVLRVPFETREMWRQIFADKKHSPEIVGDERLDVGDCVLETSVGKVQLGIAAQLEEIERGFFDLMQLRPA
jgi:flagellar assembly protein FliH